MHLQDCTGLYTETIGGVLPKYHKMHFPPTSYHYPPTRRV